MWLNSCCSSVQIITMASLLDRVKIKILAMDRELACDLGCRLPSLDFISHGSSLAHLPACSTAPGTTVMAPPSGRQTLISLEISLLLNSWKPSPPSQFFSPFLLCFTHGQVISPCVFAVYFLTFHPLLRNLSFLPLGLCVNCSE